VSTAILFSPANVERVLSGLPSVAPLLPDPSVEGVPSEAFPGVLRKTHREVYRWIANTHYQHLADAVVHLERVHAAGCAFGSLLKTHDREQFISLTAEVLLPTISSAAATPSTRSLAQVKSVRTSMYWLREWTSP
jgi:hypothetical protein